MSDIDLGSCDANKRKRGWDRRNLVRNRLNYSTENRRDSGWRTQLIEADRTDESNLTQITFERQRRFIRGNVLQSFADGKSWSTNY